MTRRRLLKSVSRAHIQLRGPHATNKFLCRLRGSQFHVFARPLLDQTFTCRVAQFWILVEYIWAGLRDMNLGRFIQMSYTVIGAFRICILFEYVLQELPTIMYFRNFLTQRHNFTTCLQIIVQFTWGVSGGGDAPLLKLPRCPPPDPDDQKARTSMHT